MKSELDNQEIRLLPDGSVDRSDIPSGVDRRAFILRSATVEAMALTAKEMNSKYKETSEGGLAVSVTLC
jgi:hypothetical protein